MRRYLNMLLFLAMVFCLNPQLSSADQEMINVGELEKLVLKLKKGELEKLAELVNKELNNPATTALTVGIGTPTPSDEFKDCIQKSPDRSACDDEFKDCIQKSPDWSACYIAADGTGVESGFSGFFSSVYDNLDFDMNSPWVRGPARLVTDRGLAK